MVVTLLGSVTVVRLEQFLKADQPIVVTFFPTLSVVSAVQSAKALASMQVTPLPMVTLESLVQPAKANQSMLVTLSGIVMLFTETPSWSSITACALPLAHSGMLSMALGYGLQIMGQRDLEPTSASIIMSLEGVFAVIFGALILQERMSSWEFLGCGLMFTAVILSIIPVKTKKKETVQP